jgi:hypothetical protein
VGIENILHGKFYTFTAPSPTSDKCIFNIREKICNVGHESEAWCILTSRDKLSHV